MAITDRADGRHMVRAMGLPISISLLIMFWAMLIALLIRIA